MNKLFHLKYGFLFKDIHVICMQNRSTRGNTSNLAQFRGKTADLATLTGPDGTRVINSPEGGLARGGVKAHLSRTPCRPLGDGRRDTSRVEL